MEVSGDGDIIGLSVEVFETKLCLEEGLLTLVIVGTSDEVTGVSNIGAVEQGLVMLSNGDQNLELNVLKSEYWEHMIDTDSSGWTLAQVP